jgi:hypothetical protein
VITGDRDRGSTEPGLVTRNTSTASTESGSGPDARRRDRANTGDADKLGVKPAVTCGRCHGLHDVAGPATGCRAVRSTLHDQPSVLPVTLNPVVLMLGVRWQT